MCHLHMVKVFHGSHSASLIRAEVESNPINLDHLNLIKTESSIDSKKMLVVCREEILVWLN